MTRKYEAVVAYDSTRGISRNGNIPWFSLDSIRKEDLQHFMELTIGGICIAGKDTYNEILDHTKGVGLKDRVTLVLSSKAHLGLSKTFGEHAYTINSLRMLDSTTDTLRLLMRASNHVERRMFVIGGASVYAQLMDQVHTVWATEIRGDFKCDKFFPKLTGTWSCKTIRETDEFTIKRYFNESPTVSI